MTAAHTVREVCKVPTSEIPRLEKRTGSDGRTRRKAAPRPEITEAERLARNAEIIRQHNEGHLSWDEIGERHRLRLMDARPLRRSQRFRRPSAG